MSAPALVGIDISSIRGWRDRITRTPSVCATAFTREEMSWAEGSPLRYARLWTVKEAVLKALGSGFDGVGWRGAEVCPGPTWPGGVRLPPSAGDAHRLAPWWSASTVVGGHAVTVVLRGGLAARCAVALRPLREVTDRGARRRAASAAARAAAADAARLLGRPRPLSWGVADSGAPVARSASGREFVLSLSHDDRLAGAVVVDSDQGNRRRDRPSLHALPVGLSLRFIPLVVDYGGSRLDAAR
ncbi:4'-phosphopantetheinyl transferase family protein [Marinactinospora thermotolerans]|uniref:Phosphopantetheinyl transferase (Holo-ACP synthase) n=1 Tax=Marinactinospora thermotolerans DSM 45154 TaxID=1122192 RepID=A0A1T4NBT5_9ACTN|nr:4'-phosphopantetheinyl transferase superfamily protein [Marinactinospora thermotolerans]SJZ76553.1 Phosphopantetheinyl transferase (holo-ACP synthase) [Marinactinospora thermotolerans DSM 45154]